MLVVFWGAAGPAIARDVSGMVDSVTVELVVPPRVRAGAPLPITLRVQNRTARTLDLYLRGRTATFDVVVAASGGEPVWRRLEGEVIPAIVHLRILAPGQALELEAVWDQRGAGGIAVSPGTYVVRGYLLAEGPALESPPAFLRIEPE